VTEPDVTEPPVTEPAGPLPRVEVRHDPAAQRFAIFVDGERAGFTQYHLHGNTWAFMHTEIDDRFAGHGLAGRLIATALDQVRASGGALLPHCPFVRHFVAEHPEYLDLVPVARRAEFDLA
jgi:predicted GNAT family acetyltransferase